MSSPIISRMKNSLIISVIVSLFIGGVAFAGGTVYQKNKDAVLAAVAPQRIGSSGASNVVIGTKGGVGGRRAGGPITSGQIIGKDSQSITVKQQDGSTKIVYISQTTTVLNTTASSLDDLTVGKQVSANGTANSDGSIAATNVQVRPTPISPTP